MKFAIMLWEMDAPQGKWLVDKSKINAFDKEAPTDWLSSNKAHAFISSNISDLLLALVNGSEDNIGEHGPFITGVALMKVYTEETIVSYSKFCDSI